MMKFEFERIVYRGEKRYQLVSISGVLREAELPFSYMETKPYMVRMGDKSVYFVWSADDPYVKEMMQVNNCNLPLLVDVKRMFTEPEFAVFVACARRCGERLHEINKKIRNDVARWNGIAIIEI